MSSGSTLPWSTSAPDNPRFAVICRQSVVCGHFTLSPANPCGWAKDTSAASENRPTVRYEGCSIERRLSDRRCRNRTARTAVTSCPRMGRTDRAFVASGPHFSFPPPCIPRDVSDERNGGHLSWNSGNSTEDYGTDGPTTCRETRAWAEGQLRSRVRRPTPLGDVFCNPCGPDQRRAVRPGLLRFLDGDVP